MDLQQVYSHASVDWLSLQVRITIEVLFSDALSIVMYEDEEERHIEDAEYQGFHPLNLRQDIKSKYVVHSGLDPSQLKTKPSPTSQVLDRSVYVVDLSIESHTATPTSKSEQEFVKNIFGVISQLPDYLHPRLNLRINFFRLIRNSQNRRQTIECSLDVLRIISNPSQDRLAGPRNILKGSNRYLEDCPLVGAQELPPVSLSPSDMMIPEISQFRDIVPESNMDILGSEASSGNLILTELGIVAYQHH
nr:heat shock factor protein HSF8-like [Ipomoea trifida]